MFTLTRARSSELSLGELVTLSDEAARSKVTLAPERGALVTAFSVAGRELLYMDEGTLKDPAQNVRGGIPVLFPTPGKVAGDRWQRAGQSGELKQHGFARNLPWSVAGESTESAAAVTLLLTSNAETLARYPWDFRFELTFTLQGGSLRISARVLNTSTRAMPFALGYHPYFLVGDKRSLHIDTRATRAFDNVTKRELPFHGFDHSAEEVDLHHLDHGSTESALHLGDASSIRVSGSPDFTRWVVWTKAGKSFVCLEPWTAPGNAFNTGEALCSLPPGAEHEAWVEIAWLARH